MKWKMNTWKMGGGDSPGTSVRFYRYCYDENFWLRLMRREYRFKMPFESRADFSSIKEGSIDEYKQRKEAHLRALHEHPFYINGTNLISWLEAVGLRGSIVVEFAVDTSLEVLLSADGPHTEVEVRLSDPGLAAMFKLAFGGK